MKEQLMNRAKLGVFVLVATTCLILGLYFIGKKKNIFHMSISVSAHFYDVGGLMPGNNVRFNGINVGTVSEVYPVSDTSIKVVFTIDEASTKFIFQNALVSIGTDGLLGNKLINISPGKTSSKPVQNGDVLVAVQPINMDEEWRTIMATNTNLKDITGDLKAVTEKLNNSHSLWNLLGDTVVAEHVRNAVVNFKMTSYNTAVVTGDLTKIMQDIKSGKGTIGALVTDSSFSHKLKQTIVSINALSDSMAIITGNFKTISENLKDGKGAVGTLLTDTNFVHNLNKSMENIKDGSGHFNENMEALQHSWFLKKYFKKQKKGLK